MLAARLRFGFEELGLNKRYATHHADNPVSGRVMQKNGMLKKGELVQHIKRDGHYHDCGNIAWPNKNTRGFNSCEPSQLLNKFVPKTRQLGDYLG